MGKGDNHHARERTAQKTTTTNQTHVHLFCVLAYAKYLQQRIHLKNSMFNFSHKQAEDRRFTPYQYSF